MTTQTPPQPALPPSQLPEGFKLAAFEGGVSFIGVNGPLYRKREGDRMVLGMRVEKRHCNPARICHGGMLMAFVDMSMVLAANYQEKLGRFLPTISLSTDFLSPAPEGVWIEGRTDILRLTRTMVFAQCLVTAEGKNIVRASGVFKLGPEMSRPDDVPGT